MEQKTSRLNQSAPSEDNDLEERIAKKFNDANNFNNSKRSIREMVTYLKDKNKKSKKKCRKHKMLTTIIKSFDTIGFFATSTSSIKLSVTGIGVFAMPISTVTACGLSIDKKLIYEIVMQKINKYIEQYQKVQQTKKYFDKLNRKSIKDNVVEKNGFESQCNIFTKYLDETKTESFF